MQRLSVWAPHATHVGLRLDEVTITMAPDAGGWFHAEAPDGQLDYAFCLDGSDPLPDPRSAWQPHGVHGPSRTFDVGAHRWSDDGFAPVPLDEAVIYELHIGTFSPEGTFVGAAERLDHLVALGVTHVELLPVAAFAGRHGWGYDGVDLYAPHPAYGTPAELQAFVDACHRHGLAVLLDVVYNHLGPEGNYLSRFGPYFTDRYRTPWGDAINVDGPGSDEVRRFLIDNAARWLRDFRFDGLRLDAVHAIVDTSALHLLEALREAVDQVARATGRPKVLTAEHEGLDPRLVAPTDRGGYGLDAVWTDDVHHALHTGLTGERTSYYEDFEGLADLVRCWNDGSAYTGRYSPHRRRTIGRPAPRHGAGALRGDQLIACLQNHDQVGNRAWGERFAELASPARQQIGAALLLTGPFVPLLFQGEEWAASTPFPYFADHDGELADAVRRGRLAEFESFGWASGEVADPEDEATFLAARLRWAQCQEPPHDAMLAWYRSLIRLRAERPELRDPTLGPTSLWDEPSGVIALRRGAITIVACTAAVGADVIITPDDPRRPARLVADAGTDANAHPATMRLLLASSEHIVAGSDHLHLAADTVAIVETTPTAP
jgi:maltooligosyltrehalose trehalohydrolase